VSAETDSEDASQVALVESVAPSCAICRRSRWRWGWRFPLVEHVRPPDRPGRPCPGIGTVPVRSTISTPTRGNLCDSARITRRPFFRRKRFTSGTLKGVFAALAGRGACNETRRPGSGGRRFFHERAAATGWSIAARRFTPAAMMGALLSVDVDGHAGRCAGSGRPISAGHWRGRFISAMSRSR